MGWMSTDAEDHRDQVCHARGGPDRSTTPKGFGPFGHLRRHWRSLRWRHRGVGSWRRLLTQGVSPRCSPLCEPLAHRSLGHSECSGQVCVLPSHVMPFPGAHPSGFAPLFWRVGVRVPASFHRPFWSARSWSLLRSIEMAC